MTLDDDLPPILTVEQTAQVLGISRGLAFTAVRAGDIPSIRIGRRILVPRDRLRQMLGVDPAEAAAVNQADGP
ncbi:MAG TPA: helix-turn-helix domain-containing protein [Frankiaceae bacterium]|jgi:excisionase family DNA binding protein|nr:helix-turn-helix domain-containing protein [Frankiaceae bacterium]